MDHVSTAGTYQSALLNLYIAQNRQNDAAAQISSGKIATDLKGYAGNAEKLTAAKSLAARTKSYIDNSSAITDRLSMQDTAMSQLGDASQAARDAIASVIASGDATPLMSSLQTEMSSAASALNTQFNGRYLFGGGQTSTQPFTGTQLSDLTSAPSIASLFKNDQLSSTSRIDDNTVLNTGFVANNLGTPLMQALQTIEIYNQGPNGPLTGKLTQAQQDFLQGVLAQFDTATSGITDATAANGNLEKKVTDNQTALENRQTTLENVIGDISNADMAQAISNLQLAQVAVQASAQVFSKLQGSSLLNVLSSGA